MSEARSLDDLCTPGGAITFDRVPKDRGNPVGPLLGLLGASRSYLRFLGSEYNDAPKLRDRAAEYLPPSMHRFLTLPVVRSRPSRYLLDRIFLGLIDGLPTSSVMDEYIRAQEPDVVLVTPLIQMQEVPQVSAVRSARKAGIPSALLVHSWDNLTNKGLVHEVPDKVVVWNAAQEDEAVQLHRVPRERVVVTGAHSYDHWFEWSVSTTRDEFCRRAGVDPAHPFILYVCSSTFIAPKEARFVMRWVKALRNSEHEAIRNLGVVIRPHPQNTEQWAKVRADDLHGAVVYPPIDADRAGQASRAEYYDSIHHSAAVMGINTTALIESAIQDRPVLTWLAPEFKDTQEGTLHFHHLASDDGLLLSANTFEQHEAHILGVLDGSYQGMRSQRFVETFVRPHGGEVNGTDLLIEQVLALGRGEGKASSQGLARRAFAIALWPLGRLLLFVAKFLPAPKRSESKEQAEPVVVTAKAEKAARRAEKQAKRASAQAGREA